MGALSAHGDWNIHLNVILLIEGPFDWNEARESWGANVEVRAIDRSSLTKKMLELIKYSAQTVPTKSADKVRNHTRPATLLP
jgi:hypothetical protein